MRKILAIAIFIVCLPVCLYAQDSQFGLTAGMTKAKLEKKFPRQTARTYRQENNQEWITFDLPPQASSSNHLVTFHLKDKMS